MKDRFPSIRPTPAAKGRAPPKFSTVSIPIDLRRDIEMLAVGIFTDMVNSGHSVQAAILAVYLSGVNHGIEGKP